jgi:hypothetical protein
VKGAAVPGEITFEPHPATEEFFACPKCKKTEDVHFAEYVLRQIKLREIKDGVAIFDLSSDEMNWDVNKSQHLYCDACDEEWPVPSGMRIDFQ